MNTAQIPGYTFGTAAVARSPLTEREFDLLKQTVLFTDNDVRYLRMAGEVLSFWRPVRQAHLAICGIALWLIGFGFLASPPPAPPALQNQIPVGLLLLMFAIVPNEAGLPPHPWRDFCSAHKKTTQQAEGQTGERAGLRFEGDRP